MKISVDAGALCGREHFGNYTMTENFIKAVNLFDNDNSYYLYGFCDKPLWLKTNKNIQYLKISPKRFWMAGRVTLEEQFVRKDLFLALNQAIPVKTPAKIFSFSHGLSFHKYPKYYPEILINKLEKQLANMFKKSSLIIVSSRRVKRELTELNPASEYKIKVIPFGIPFDMLNQPICTNKEKYFLYVGMDHPIKNIRFIKSAFKKFTTNNHFTNYCLKIITDARRDQLKSLYQHATALLTASYYESFNFPVLEALSQGCPVVGLNSAIIPELKNYVLLANNLTQFTDAMQIIANEKNTAIDIGKLKEQFSWESYIHCLLKLGKIGI